jgi:Uma2 family endonuclease
MSGSIIEASEETLHASATGSSRVTFEEYLASTDERHISEWVDGEVIFISPVTEIHQAILFFVAQILGLYVETHNLGRVYTSGYPMKLEGLRRGREPDVLFVENDRLHILERTFINGPVDLAVEIVSEESGTRDRVDKFAEYERAGVREYWLMDPASRTAEFYLLGIDGRYHRVEVDGDGLYHATVVPGFFLRTNWLWQSPLPTIAALRELGLM